MDIPFEILLESCYAEFLVHVPYLVHVKSVIVVRKVSKQMPTYLPSILFIIPNVGSLRTWRCF
jgi:hypothetical protein